MIQAKELKQLEKNRYDNYENVWNSKYIDKKDIKWRKCSSCDLMEWCKNDEYLGYQCEECDDFI